MKRLTKLILMSVLTLMLVCMSVVPAFAAEALVVNGQNAAVGSTVTYTFSISDAQQKLAGIHLVIFFDQEYLELKDVNDDNLGNSTINDNQNGDGQIIIVNPFINGQSGLNCEEKTEIVTVTFEAINEGTTEITYYMPYLYDLDMVNIYDYRFSCDLEVDGETLIEDKTPVLQDISQIPDFPDAGDFANNEEGTGSGVKPVATAATNADNAGNAGDNSGSASTGGDTDPDNTVVVAIVCACIIVAAIVVLAVIKAKKTKIDKE